MKRWLKLTLITEPVLVEPIADFFVGIIDAGVEIGVDDSPGVKTVNAYVEKEDPTPAETERILLQVQVHVSELAAIFGVDSPKVSWEVIEEEDWSKNWKEHFTPFKVAEGLVIAPTWEKYSPADGEKVIVMDPGMAFGTGHHATTSLVLDLLGQVIATNDREHTVLDVGTGTGILGMAAALFGVRCVYAVDNDPVAVAAAVDNIEQNGLAAVMRADDTPLEMIDGQFSLVLANIVHDVLLDMAKRLADVTLAGGRLILSGILEGEQVESITSVYGGYGFVVKKQKARDGWAALLFEKSD